MSQYGDYVLKVTGLQYPRETCSIGTVGAAPMSQDLFAYQGEQRRRQQAPLADRMRPRTLEEFEGQQGILA